ncbi:unnamed protein product [Fraxinus pennsylvanica]|uniref:Large ribosomal subunit protein bL9c n=1 Tax=Fraxinus pennsylvanica TaxID=56036 RepID=A0AAD1ZRJ9_9LAMI|nr:unnamed protein product [Fraxinus pennsylvanica]
MPVANKRRLGVVIPPKVASNLITKSSNKLNLISHPSGADVDLIEDKHEQRKMVHRQYRDLRGSTKTSNEPCSGSLPAFPKQASHVGVADEIVVLDGGVVVVPDGAPPPTEATTVTRTKLKTLGSFVRRRHRNHHHFHRREPSVYSKPYIYTYMAYLHYGKNILRRSSGGGLHHPLLYAAQGVRYRKLEVILTTTIDKLGKAGETVKVAPGYFRNHLMPKLLAVPNIDKFAHLISEQRKMYQPKDIEEVKEVSKTEEDRLKEYQSAANRLDSARLNLRRFIIEGKGNELRHPVTKEEILAEVARQLQVRIEPENLQLPAPLSSLGEYELPLRLPKSIPKPQGYGE